MNSDAIRNKRILSSKSCLNSTLDNLQKKSKFINNEIKYLKKNILKSKIHLNQNDGKKLLKIKTIRRVKIYKTIDNPNQKKRKKRLKIRNNKNNLKKIKKTNINSVDSFVGLIKNKNNFDDKFENKIFFCENLSVNK